MLSVNTKILENLKKFKKYKRLFLDSLLKETNFVLGKLCFWIFKKKAFCI